MSSFSYFYDTDKLGMIHTCTFILLRLSGDRDFAVSLNQPLPNAYRVLTLFADLPQFATASLIDLVVLVFVQFRIPCLCFYIILQLVVYLSRYP